MMTAEIYHPLILMVLFLMLGELSTIQKHPVWAMWCTVNMVLWMAISVFETVTTLIKHVGGA